MSRLSWTTSEESSVPHKKLLPHLLVSMGTSQATINLLNVGDGVLNLHVGLGETSTLENGESIKVCLTSVEKLSSLKVSVSHGDTSSSDLNVRGAVELFLKDLCLAKVVDGRLEVAALLEDIAHAVVKGEPHIVST